LHKIFLDILTFVDAFEIKFSSLKVWNWIVQSYKIKPKSCHVINPPLSNLVKLGQSSQLWTNCGQSESNDQTRGAKLEIGQKIISW